VSASTLASIPVAPPSATATNEAEVSDEIYVLELTVEEEREAERLRKSAQAVQVIELEEEKKQAADMGEVLARSEGVGVRRSGGLGSGERVALNGFTGEQVRFFIDGVPLELAGFGIGLANVPINLVERVEIYKGVVPIRLGADALGGAINLVTTQYRDTGGSLSYQIGSFDTHRVTLGARTFVPSYGLYARVNGFLDYAKNDYPIDVEVPDADGRLNPATAYRFHDMYRARGAGVEIGIVNKPWAERLAVTAYGSGHNKELQHNVVMTVPYGKAEYGGAAYGATLRYEQPLFTDFRIDALGGFGHKRIDFLDRGVCIYDWFGRCIRTRRQGGEIEGEPIDQTTRQNSGYARVNGSWNLSREHTLRVSVSPTYVTRTGKDYALLDPNSRDPMTARRDLTTVVSGIEHESRWFQQRLENVLFAKNYLFYARSEEPLPGGRFRDRNANQQHLGYGDALRLKITDNIYHKTSYEFATRLPGAEELFGDGVLILPNLVLDPETSHNLNFGGFLETVPNRAGSFHTELNLFGRIADDLIVLLGDDKGYQYHNVYSATSQGIEAALGWRSPGDYLALDGNTTWQEFRNTSTDGAFGDFTGDRIPNRPWFFANGNGRLQFSDVASPVDQAALFWNTRYVHSFFRTWESLGLREFKQIVDPQFVHSAGLTYAVRGTRNQISGTLEVQNLTDENVYDYFGIQKPGRAVYLKMTTEL
jgi:outer membrane cobalamin receptor